jgi:transformer-2 protein
MHNETREEEREREQDERVRKPRPEGHHDVKLRREEGPGYGRARGYRYDSRYPYPRREYPRSPMPMMDYPPRGYYMRPRGRPEDYDIMMDRRYYGRYPPYYREPRRRERRIPVNPEPMKVLGIFGVDIKMREDELTDWIKSKIGDIPIEKIHLIINKYTGFSKGFGFIYFNNIEDATKAKELMDGQLCGANSVRVDYSITQEGREREREEPYHMRTDPMRTEDYQEK